VIAVTAVRADAESVDGEDAALRRLFEDRLYVSIGLAAVLCVFASVAWLDVRLLLAFPLSVGALSYLFGHGKLERFPEKREDELFY
jgi:hypothetical protein